MEKIKKSKYLQPKIKVFSIEFEESFAVGSSTLLPGDPYNENTPKVQDWNNSWDTDRNFDI